MNASGLNSDPLAQSLPTVYEAVRKSRLINVLHDKLDSLPAGAFPFVTEFAKLRDVIQPQIGETRILFPEFTPHDESLHVVKLFQLADKLFGISYQQLNAAELFLLSCALYAHDWGMAVGQEEKTYLCHGAAVDYLRDSFNPLPDESERLDVFIRAEGLQRDADGAFPTLSDDHLRLYARATHARRSGARVRAHFQEYPAVGEALAQICEGHWHDFATLDDPQRFHHEYEVAGHTAHILALALQVRIIDLFHITDDRTPYALWRFVSPADRKSNEEWKKHRALHAVTPIDFHPGRAIKVQGFTEDEEVWAGLQDLRRYCEDQLNRTLNLSARHVPERYLLNFVKLEWAVTTGTLLPVDFSFGFDSKAMFRILSDDIYDGDSYVFLRELLQNSIDAVRTRLSRHEQRAKDNTKKKRTSHSFDTTIYFKADHQRNGDILVSCRDYGIGMDEHVIRNYFTVAGVSYYRSGEFERQHLGFEPVSRFGIGILSCFMVADALEVKTYRDPECGPVMTHADSQLPGAAEHRPRRLHLRVPAVERQFIVKDLSEDFEVGTEVSLKVLKNKIKEPQKRGPASKFEETVGESGEETKFKRSLNITEYLCDIAGFVQYPILVEESWPGQDSPKYTLILHPNADEGKERAQFDLLDLSVHQLSPNYPWEKVMLPESLETALEMMTEHCFNIQELLGDEGYEGWVVFPVPKPDIDIVKDRQIYIPTRDKSVALQKRGGKQRPETVFWDKDLLDYYEYFRLRVMFGVYRDGILLGGIWPERSFLNNSSDDAATLPPLYMHINLPSSGLARPNVARTNLVPEVKSWEEPVLAAVKKHLQATEVFNSLALPVGERLYRLGWLATVFGLFEKELSKMVPDSKKVSVWLVPPGKLELREGVIPCDDETPLVPEKMIGFVAALVAEHCCLSAGNAKMASEWQGPRSVFGNQSSDIIPSIPLSAGLRIAAQWVTLRQLRVQFLEIPTGKSDLFIQFIGKLTKDSHEGMGPREWSPQAKLIHDELLATAIAQPMQVDFSQFPTMHVTLGLNEFLKILPFSAPFSDHFAGIGDTRIINQLHPVGQAIIRCYAASLLAIREQKLPAAATRELNELLFDFSFNSRLDPIKNIGEFVTHLFEFVAQHRLIDGFVAPPLPDLTQWVQNIRNDFWKKEDVMDLIEGKGQKIRKFKRPFGKLITEWPLPDREPDSSKPPAKKRKRRGNLEEFNFWFTEQ